MKFSLRCVLPLLSCVVVFVAGCHADAPVEKSAFHVADYFGDHMVLQRNEPIAVWGEAKAGDEISVTLGDSNATTKTDDTGHWLVRLPARDVAKTPLELKVASGGENKTFQDILIGDVWLISGQSNVVLTLAATTEAAQAKAEPTLNDVRVMKLPANFAFTPSDAISRKVSWDVLNPARVSVYLSGVGYHFIRTVQPAVGVPMGLVQASAGGTQVEQWTPEAALKAVEPDNPLFAMRDRARDKLAADPNARIGVNESGATSLYNGIIHPFRYAKLKGVVWYQGEANTRSKRDYRPVLKTFVQAWREVFAQKDLPFVIVQLPNFGLPKDDGWMRVREAQRLVAQELGLSLVVTIDQGSAVTIHPPNKAEVGRRAGLAALQHVYGKDMEGTSPFPKDVNLMGREIVVEFDGFKGDLQVRGDTITGFEIAGTDGKYFPAIAKLEGRSVILHADGLQSLPQIVRYLWSTSPQTVSLYSAAGLPVGPFKVED